VSLASLIERASERWSAWLRRRIVWVGAERRALDASSFSGSPWIVILGREHYEERRKLYGIRSWRGLRAVLQLEEGSDPAVLYAIGPYGAEGREVRSFRLLPSGIAAREGALFVLPESLLLAHEVQANESLSIQRDGLEYYLARGVASQLRGGTIINERLFALSAGLPEESAIRSLDLMQLGGVLERRVRHVSLGMWWTLLVARERWVTTLPWKSLATTTAVALVAYLAASSAYLEAGNWWRERQLAALGSDVDKLITRQREIDRAAAELKGMQQLASERMATHHLWGVLAELWRAGGTLSGFEIRGDELTVRGGAPAATSVLAAISKLPQVRSAKFDAPVRSDYGQENFTIVLTLVTSESRP
jgi:hypothetical protein